MSTRVSWPWAGAVAGVVSLAGSSACLGQVLPVARPRAWAMAVAPVPCMPRGTLVSAGLLPGGALSSLTAVSDDGVWAVGTAWDAANTEQVVLYHVPTNTRVTLGATPNPALVNGQVVVSNSGAVVGTVPGQGTYFWGGPFGAPVVDVSGILAPALTPASVTTISHDARFFGGIAANTTTFNTDGFGFNIGTGALTSPTAAFGPGALPYIRDCTDIRHTRFPGQVGDIYVVGTELLTGPNLSPFISLNGTAVLDVLPPAAGGGMNASASVISADGTVVGGSQINFTGTLTDAVLWRFEVPFNIGRLQNDTAAEVTGLSADGRWAVGVSERIGTSRRGFLFDSLAGSNVMRPLLPALTAEFCIPTTGWTQLVPRDMSANGVIVGDGVFNGQSVGFVARIPVSNYCYADFDKNGVLNANDMNVFLFVFASGNLTMPFTDANGDGLFPDPADVVAFQAMLAGSCP